MKFLAKGYLADITRPPALCVNLSLTLKNLTLTTFPGFIYANGS